MELDSSLRGQRRKHARMKVLFGNEGMIRVVSVGFLISVRSALKKLIPKGGNQQDKWQKKEKKLYNCKLQQGEVHHIAWCKPINLPWSESRTRVLPSSSAGLSATSAVKLCVAVPVWHWGPPSWQSLTTESFFKTLQKVWKDTQWWCWLYSCPELKRWRRRSNCVSSKDLCALWRGAKHNIFYHKETWRPLVVTICTQ